MRKFYSIIFLLSLLQLSCSPQIAKGGKPENIFKAEVTHEVSRDLSSYDMLFVPRSLVQDGKELGYFRSVMSHKQIDRLIDLEPGEPVNPREVTIALSNEGLDSQYLVLEEIIIFGQRNYLQWNLTDPINDELFFSSRIQVNRKKPLEASDGLRHSLIDYLDENSQKISGKSKEERKYNAMRFGIHSFTSLVNASTDLGYTTHFGLGLGLFGEYRFSQPLALKLSFNGSWTGPNDYKYDTTMIYTAPLHLKWYLTNSLEIHAGPQVNYISVPEALNSSLGDLIQEKNLGWDLSFGVSYKWNERYMLMLTYSRGMNEVGKIDVGGSDLQLETFSLGFGFKF